MPDWAVALSQMLPADLGADPLVGVRYEPHSGSYFNGDDPIALVGQVPDLVHLRLGLRSGVKADGPYDPFACDLLIEAVSSAPLADVKAAFRFVPDQVRFASIAVRETAVSAQSAEPAGRSLRVDAQRVNDLAALVDELVSAKTGLARVVAKAHAGAEIREVAASLATQYSAIDRLVGLAHQRVMALRMAPVRPLLQRFLRVVRDMARTLGKDLALAIEGDGVEADRGIIEGLFEPLTHLLRNAVDHSVESAERRRLAGKPDKAVITLDARERGGRLVLTVRDDGAGIDAEAIRRIAEMRGLRDRDSLAAMDDASVDRPDFHTRILYRGIGHGAVGTWRGDGCDPRGGTPVGRPDCHHDGSWSGHVGGADAAADRVADQGDGRQTRGRALWRGDERGAGDVAVGTGAGGSNPCGARVQMAEQGDTPAAAVIIDR